MMTRSGIQVEFVREPTVDFLHPSRGYSMGGTVVTVTGTDFVAGQTACLFGSHQVPVVANVTSATELRCVAPADLPGEIAFEVTANYQGQAVTLSQHSRSSRLFVYDGRTDVVDIEPKSGPTEGSTIRLTMSHVPAGAAPTCVFDSRLFVEADVSKAGSVSCGVPARVAGNATVAIASNGQDFVGLPFVFLYENIANVTDTHRLTRVPVMGGSVITVRGSGFPLAPGKARCRVSGTNIVGAAGGVWSPGEILTGATTDSYVTALVKSPTELSCAMPARGAGYRAVEITMNEGKDFSRSGIQLEFVAPVINRLEAARAPVFGGTVITVHGRGFRADMSACVFGSTVVMAEVKSTVELTCATPRTVPGVVGFEVTASLEEDSLNKGQYAATQDNRLPYLAADYSQSGLSFQFVAAPHFMMSPTTTHGTIAGGTVVRLTTKVLKPIMPIHCKFLNVLVLAKIGQDHSIECLSTSQRHVGNVSVSVVYNGQELQVGGRAFEYTAEHNVTGWESLHRDAAGPTSAFIRAHVGRRLLATDTSLGGQFVENGQLTSRFQYGMLSMEPYAGSVRGGFMLKVKAPHPTAFALASDRARARFGTTVVPVRAYAEWRGRGQLSRNDYHEVVAQTVVMQAIAPPSAAGFTSVEFAYNGITFSTHGRQIEFFEASRVSHIFPSTAVPHQGTVVTVMGSNFRGAGQTFCRFGVMPALRAVYVSSQEVRCHAPATPLGPMRLAIVTGATEADGVTQHSEALDEDAMRFEFLRGPQIHRVQRDAGPMQGGSIINVHGARFHDSPSAFCRIDSRVIVPALRQGPNRLRCYSPAYYVEPNYVASNHTVEVSFNGVDFSNQGHTFEYHREFNVTSLYPSKGPVAGGTVVTVTGTGFNRRTARLGYFGCRFGGIKVPATYISSTQLKCISPVAPAAFRDVEVTTNSIYSHGGVQFEQQETVRTFSILPSSGPITGGTMVTVHGSNFHERVAASHLPSIMCRFGLARTPATIVSTSMLLCRSPEMVSGRNYLTISINNEDQALNPLDYSQLTTVFDYHGSIRIDGFYPRSGPTVGGTVVSVMGAGFQSAPGLTCRFGVITSKAVFSNDSMVTCEVPTHEVGLVPVEVSNNAEDFAEGPPYIFYTTPNVTSVYPRKGLTYGGTPVFITGFGFTNSTDLKCKFDRNQAAIYVPATFLSSSLLLCLAPSHSRAMVTIEVTNNGVDYTHSYQLFEYTKCPIGHYCPDFEVIPSPNGTFSPSEDMRNFTLCFPGTYQSAIGQKDCVPCPVGYVCPDYGMMAPRVCPAGVVCEETALAVGPELKPCPPGHYCRAGTSTADPSGEDDQDRPFPCPEGTYCNYGVVTNESSALNFTTPQMCYSGFYCPMGSRSPQGAGECPPGYYCPEAIAIACPPGTFCKGFGNSQPKECQPGTYNPSIAQPECKQSEPGTISPGFGRLLPAPCPAGFVCNTTGGALPASRCPKGFFCLIGTLTSNASSPEGTTQDEAIKMWRSKRPYPCPPGTYCLDGVNTPYSKKGDLVTPQPCTPGAFCVNATKDATGETCSRYEYGSPEDFKKQTWTTINPRPDGTSEIVVIVDDECGGPCPPGHYCPINSSIPTPAPQGTFSKGFGNVQATLCFAGTFAPNSGSSQCLPCPAGYQCPKDGVWQPTICPPGRYRSLDDTITCQMCPPGTWSAKYGVTDQTFCEACPAGRVCSLEAMTSLAQSNPCPQGFVCDTYTFQATARCHAGFWCDYGTTPARQNDHLCPKGYYCLLGTSKNQRQRNACPQNYYCPAGTDTSRPVTKCPKGTKSDQQAYILENCTRRCDDPDTNPTLYDENLNSQGCIVAMVSPIHPNSTAKSNVTGKTVFKLKGLEVLKFEVDLTGLDYSMRYNDHWRLGVYSNDSLLPLPHTKWFMNMHDSQQLSNLQDHIKHQVLDFQLMARTAEMTVKIQLELLHGLYAPFVQGGGENAGNVRGNWISGDYNKLYQGQMVSKEEGWQWNNTLNAVIRRPTRAVFGVNTGFMAIVQNDGDQALPQNLPKWWGAEIDEDPDVRKENLVYFDYRAENDSVPMIWDDLNDKVATPELFWNKQMDGAKFVPLPYIPYFSQCRGYGSHIPVFDLLENPDPEKCELVAPEDTIYIDQFMPHIQEALADNCSFSFTCAYEEALDAADTRTRWFDVATGDPLFSLTAEPFTFDELEAVDPKFAAALQTKLEVPVGVESEGSVGTFPRSVSMSIGFFQMDADNKMLISADLVYEDFEPINRTRLGTPTVPIAAFQDGTLDYTFSIETAPLTYIDLVNAFAFDYLFYCALFVVIGIFSVSVVAMFWATQRLCTRLAHPPKFRFWAYLRVLAPNPLKGCLLAILVTWAGVIAVLMIFRPYGVPFFDTYQTNWDIVPIDPEEDPDLILANRAGRTGLSFVVLGFIMMWEGTKAFIPLPNLDEGDELDEDEEEDMFDELDSSSEEEEEDEVPTDDDLLPEEMRRSHLMFAAIMEMGFLLLVVEFSYSSLFGDYIWTCLIVLKVVQMLFEQMLCNYIKDVLLLCPLMVGLEMTQFVVTMGADGFIDFLMSYCVELVLVLAERVYFDPALKAVGSVFPYIQVFFLRRYIDIRQAILDPEGLEDKEEVPDPEEPEENVIEDLIDAFQVYANETTACVQAPFLILWMLVFSKELQLVDTYGIRDTDLILYVLFAIFIVPTQMCMDVFIQNSQELFHGWKIYEYLRYAQQRFINRTERWKLNELEQDESIDKNLRACDQLCFSTQFYFINALLAHGIVFVVFALEIMILWQYNMFGDQAFAAIVAYVMGSAYAIKWLALQSADFIGLWMVLKKPEGEEKSALASMGSGSGSMSRASGSGSRSKGGGGVDGGVTQRMRSQDLMHAFLEQNRPWMLQNLANIFTSEFLARNPPWIVRELAKVFGITPGMGVGGEPDEEDRPLGRTTVAADISSDEGSDASEEMPDFGKMDHLLTNAVHKVALRWLSFVRTEETGKYDISSDSDSDEEEDGQYEPAMITDSVRDIAETWLRKVAKHLRDERAKMGKGALAAEISSDSSSESDGEFGVMETLNEVTTAIAIKWLEKIRGKAAPKTDQGLRADISSDDSDDEDEGPVEVDYEPAKMNEKTTQIAFRWLRSVRAKRRPLTRVDISSDSDEGDDGDVGGRAGEISSDDSDDEDGVGGAQTDLQVPSTKAIAFKWLGKVRRAEVKTAWEDETDIVEDVAPKQRMERKKPKAKKKK
jgi:hypothetical protein